MSYNWQNPRGLGSCRADRFPGCTSHFCPCRVVMSLSVPSAGSLIIMHMLTRLQEMSQFVVCFASKPARYLACVRKATCPTDTPRSEDMAQGSFFLHNRGWEGVFHAQICPNPFSQSSGMEGHPVGTKSGGCVLDRLSESPNLPSTITISQQHCSSVFPSSADPAP